METTTNMLSGREHHLWKSSELAKKLQEHLGQSAEACIATMADMQEQLEAIEEKGKEFIPTEPTSKQTWQKHFRKKLKFSVSEPHIDRCISNLRDLNQDFSVLATQTTKLLSATSSEKPSDKSIYTVKQCQRIQQASFKFYEALETACSSHNEHEAHLKVIQPSFAEFDQTLEVSNIRFCVGLSTKLDRTPVWLAVGSMVETDQITKENFQGFRSDMEEVIRLGFALKHMASPGCAFDNTKRSRTELISPTPPPSSCPNSPTSSAQTNGSHHGLSNKIASIPNFCISQDLCLHISRICKTSLSDDFDTCFGYLSKSSETHELYLENQEDYAQGSISLTELVGSMAERHCIDPFDRVPLLECVRLARNVALAVLQFHATPLLRPSWSGDDIVFCGLDVHNHTPLRSDVLATIDHIPEPYLRTIVNSEVLHSTIAPQLSKEKHIRNLYLYRLGVALLEIAYQTPLQRIRCRPGTSIHTEFEIADHCSQTVSAILGPRYAKIVRKCLGCDFGHDVDLTCEELRLAVHKDVVLELEGLLEDFEKKISFAS